MTGYRLDDSGSIPGRGQDLFTTMFRLALGPPILLSSRYHVALYQRQCRWGV